MATFYLIFFNSEKNFVKKRYTHFLELYETLKHRIDVLQSGEYRFPNKSIFNTSAKFTKERRKKGFDELLRIIVAHPECEQELLEFLEIPYQFDDSNEHLSRVNSSPQPALVRRQQAMSSEDLSPSKSFSSPEEEDDWPLFSYEALRVAVVAGVAIYATGVCAGWIAIAGASSSRVALTVSLLVYALLLSHRILTCLLSES